VNPRNFFSGLKRRNVYKVAVAYPVGAWLFVRAASIILPTFEAPAWYCPLRNFVLSKGHDHDHLQDSR
jgi:hypothetical protein